MDSTYYYCKCSICFENDSEMEFINCGDQYCFPCLERYVEYLIKEGSWGLLPAELTCPVCGLEMQEEDWMPYISNSTIELWNKFKLKRRENMKNLIISRSCPICNHSQSIMGSNSNFSDFLLLSHQLMTFLDSNFERNSLDLETATDLLKDFDEYDFQDFIELSQESFEEFLNLLEKLKCSGCFKPSQRDFIKLLLEFGRIFLKLIYEKFNEIISSETSADLDDIDSASFILINLQLNFQSIFPFSQCEICGLEFCLPCQGLNWFHIKENDPNSDSDSVHVLDSVCDEIIVEGPCHANNTRLDGSKQCPRCFIRIEKEPEGCNEMRCNYCGMKFCWECGKKWSKNCGIFNCNAENIPRYEKNSIGRDPEIGVPNVRIMFGVS